MLILSSIVSNFEQCVDGRGGRVDGNLQIALAVDIGSYRTYGRLCALL